jgi:uncharacterized membrane protein YtjA (UPF0391 family)
MLANAVSMVALLGIGGLTDAIGVASVLFVVAGMTLLMALFSVYMRRLAAQDPPALLDRLGSAGEAEEP